MTTSESKEKTERKNTLKKLSFQKCEKLAERGFYKATFPNSVFAMVDFNVARTYIESQGLIFEKYSTNCVISWEE